jgi:2-keto-4-pentenoate hydratase/2-oxohepta-3-ene-1,7-dioic acid hydratase in catechol pathway
MRFVTFSRVRPGSWRHARPGILLREADLVIDLLAWIERREGLASFAPPAHYLDWFDLDGPWSQVARAAASEAEGTGDWDEWLASGLASQRESIRLLSPVPRPGKIVCVGLNYRDHAAEAGMALPERPLLFAKFPSAVVGPGEDIELPASGQRVDYEAELAVVIGRRARRVAAADAYRYVFGYTNANDVSERGFQKQDGQWVRAKSCDTFSPLGPAVVTTEEVEEPGALPIRLRLNGRVMQDSNTDQFVFDVPRLIESITETSTLEPGDVILTGTPPGVGFARQPPIYLQPGDLVEVAIGDLGVLSNRVVSARQ